MSSFRRYANIGHTHVVADITDLDLSSYLTAADLVGYTQAAVDETITGSWTFDGGLTVDSSGTEPLSITRSGSADLTIANSGSGDLTFDHSGSGSIRFLERTDFEGSDVRLLTNGILRLFNSDDTQNSFLRTQDVSSASADVRLGIRNAGGGSMAMQSATIADDATATFKVPTYGMFFLTNNFNSTAFAHWGQTTTQAPVDYGSGSNVSLGSTNPDVDTDVNIWPSSSGVISIKNRLGSSRIFYLLSFGVNEGAT